MPLKYWVYIKKSTLYRTQVVQIGGLIMFINIFVILLSILNVIYLIFKTSKFSNINCILSIFFDV